jgi:hypothetical protein
MNTTASVATSFITANKGEMVTIGLKDDTSVTGTAISVNSKGVNLNIDGKVRSFGLSRVVTFALADEAADEADRLEELANEVSDGASTAEVAAILSDYLDRELTAKELRVHLRALGLGVGKGNKYALSEGEFRAVIKVIRDSETAAAAN